MEILLKGLVGVGLAFLAVILVLWRIVVALFGVVLFAPIWIAEFLRDRKKSGSPKH